LEDDEVEYDNEQDEDDGVDETFSEKGAKSQLD
jgi:hypothetical protein